MSSKEPKLTHVLDGPAFPVPDIGCAGMSYREWLVGQAVCGISSTTINTVLIAELSLRIADAVLVELNKEK